MTTSLVELVTLYSDRHSEIETPDFNSSRATWREFVPSEVAGVWPQLSFEAKLVAFLTADEAFLNRSL